MAGPVPDDERRRGLRRVAAGFAAFVAVSAGLVAYRSGATPKETGVVVLAGLLLGVVLLLVITSGRSFTGGRSSRGRDRRRR